MEEKLILAVENHPILYDKSLFAYKSLNGRENAWKEVGKEIHSRDIDNLKKRWRTLRDAFIKHYRMTKLNKRGSAGGKKKKWIYYDQMLFLIPFIEFKDTIRSYSQDDSQNYTEGSGIGVSQNIVSEETDTMISRNINQDNKNTQDMTKAVLTDTSKLIPAKQQTTEGQNCLRKTNTEEACKKSTSKMTHDRLMEIITKNDDPDEQFMLSCVPTLKKLTPRNNMIARIRIQQLLFQLQFGETCESRPSTRASALSTNSESSADEVFSPPQMENDCSTNASCEPLNDNENAPLATYKYFSL